MDTVIASMIDIVSRKCRINAYTVIRQRDVEYERNQRFLEIKYRTLIVRELKPFKMAWQCSFAASCRLPLNLPCALPSALKRPRLTPRCNPHRVAPVSLAHRNTTRQFALAADPSRTQRYLSPIRPKQSLGQNFLRDGNIIRKITLAFNEALATTESQVVEIGAGTGALTKELLCEHPDMLAVEIDQRAVEVLRETFPSLNVLHADVLEVDWEKMGNEKPLAVIGNLPYNIVSQILLSMLEARRGSIRFALVMMQREVAERVCAKPRTKAFGILSVVSQLYAKPELLFNVPNTAFYPKPSITSTMVLFRFEADPCFDVSNYKLKAMLRTVVRSAFQQRRKTLRNSLRAVYQSLNVELDDTYASKRAEELTPQQFVDLTRHLYDGNLDVEDGEDADGHSVWRPRKR